MRDSSSQQRARTLRARATDTERFLWTHLRRHQLGGYRFRRQFPVGHYVVDFACLEANLVIELDGGLHLERHAYDTNRARYIELQGFRVLRFWDNQVFEETAAVLEVILNALSSHRPHPDFPPLAGEGM